MDLHINTINDIAFEKIEDRVNINMIADGQPCEFNLNIEEFSTYAMNIHKIYIGIQNILNEHVKLKKEKD